MSFSTPTQSLLNALRSDRAASFVQPDFTGNGFGPIMAMSALDHGDEGAPMSPPGDINRIADEVTRRHAERPLERLSDIHAEVWFDRRENGKVDLVAELDSLTIEEMLFESLRGAFMNDTVLLAADLQDRLDLSDADIAANWPTAHLRFTKWLTARAERRGDGLHHPSTGGSSSCPA